MLNIIHFFNKNVKNSFSMVIISLSSKVKLMEFQETKLSLNARFKTYKNVKGKKFFFGARRCSDNKLFFCIKNQVQKQHVCDEVSSIVMPMWYSTAHSLNYFFHWSMCCETIVFQVFCWCKSDCFPNIVCMLLIMNILYCSVYLHMLRLGQQSLSLTGRC